MEVGSVGGGGRGGVNGREAALVPSHHPAISTARILI